MPRILSVLILCVFAAVPGVSADDKPPLTKEQERLKFHPRRLGMDAAARQAAHRKRLERILKPARLKKDVKAGRITVADLGAYMQEANRELFENEVVATEVYRSDDGGATWKRTHDGRIDKVFHSFGYYFGRIAVDPADPERVYIQGVPMLTSTDGGKSWKGIGGRGVHGDYHAILIDPKAPQRLTIGNDCGINVSYDYGETWTKLNNLPVGQFTMIAVDSADPYNIVGGLQDNGVMRGPSTYRYGKTDPQAGKSIYGGDGSCVAIDPKDPNIVYAALQFGVAARLNVKTGERTSIRPRPELSAKKKEKPLRYNWIAPFLLSPHSRDVLYFGTNKLYRSFDRGDTWTAISEDLTSNPALSPSRQVHRRDTLRVVDGEDHAERASGEGDIVRGGLREEVEGRRSKVESGRPGKSRADLRSRPAGGMKGASSLLRRAPVREREGT